MTMEKFSQREIDKICDDWTRVHLSRVSKGKLEWNQGDIVYFQKQK